MTKSEAVKNLEAMGAISMTCEELDQLPYNASEELREQLGIPTKEWPAKLKEMRPNIIKELEELQGPQPCDEMPTEMLLFQAMILKASMEHSGQTKDEFKADMERENGPFGIIDDLFVMLRFAKEGVVPFVWPQVNNALKMADELSAADPVRWRQFLQECNELQPGSIPGGMLQ